MTSKLTTPLHREAQLELEAHGLRLGIAKYHETLQTQGMEGLPPGKQLLKAAMEPMVDGLKAWLNEAREGLASRSASVFYFLDGLDPEAVAFVTANTCLSRLHEEPRVVNAASHIALRLEETVNLDAIAKEHPKLADKIAKRFANLSDAKNRVLVVRKGADMVDVKVVQWDDDVRIRVGSLLIALFAQHTGLVAVETDARGDGKAGTRRASGSKSGHIRPTESCRKWLEEAHARCELLSPVRLPMVCMPDHWTNPFNGGYLTKEMRQPLVKTRNRGYLTTLKDWDMPHVYAAVNALQDTEWAINKGIYGVVRELWEAGRTDGGIPDREGAPLPSRSWDEGMEPDPAILSAWKVDAAKVYEANEKLTSKRVQMAQKLWVAEQMLERGNRFHYVYNLDWRGRMYPIASSLSPQGDDLSKAMLCFSHGHPLGGDGAYWLAIHGANCFGVDKVSFADRIEWVQANEERILEAANRPTNGTMWWCEADSPFVFLAFCFEYAALQRHVDAGGDQDTFVSYVPVAFDGACNGLQNFSAMLRDPVGGKATGLIPSETPSDIYTQVKDAAQKLVDADAAAGHEVAQRWVGKLTRKLAKRNTMTVPYGVTKRGMRDQLFVELTSEGKERAEDAEYLSATNFAAIGNVVVAARLAMDWLREAAKVAASNGLPVRWTTPMGYLAVQDYREEIGKELDFVVAGRRFRLMVQRDGDKLNSRKQALGISPNFVHSLDAAHLMRTVLHCVVDGVTSFAMIHDSYGCHAGLATLLRDNLRSAFVEQYTPDVLARFREELCEQLPEELRAELPPLPAMGDLELEQVKSSEYFFA